MKTIQNDRYTYRVTWSDEDGEYVSLNRIAALSWHRDEWFCREYFESSVE